MAHPTPNILILHAPGRLREALRQALPGPALRTQWMAASHEGLTEARKPDTALAILDLDGEQPNGQDVLRELRYQARTEHLPVMLVTEGRKGAVQIQQWGNVGPLSVVSPQDLDPILLRAEIATLLELHVRALTLQTQVCGLLNDTMRMSGQHENFGNLLEGMHRRLLKDVGTGLANALHFDEQLEALLRRATRNLRPFALAWVHVHAVDDLRNSLGDEAVNELMLAVADCIEAALRGSDAIARLGSSVLGLLLDGVSTPSEANLALEKAMESCQQAVKIQSRSVLPELSVGVALCPRQGHERAQLLHLAQRAAALASPGTIRVCALG